jgi:integrase
MSNIIEVLKTNKPSLSENTIKGYEKNIKTIYKQMFPTDKGIDIEKLKSLKIEDFKKYIPTSETNTISYIVNLMSAIQAFTDIKAFTDEISKLNKERKTKAMTQEPTEDNINNHVTQEQLDAKYNELYEKTKGYWEELDKSFDMNKYMELQDYIIFCLVSSKFVPVRRARDYYDFKIRRIDLEKDNYLEGHELVYNAYKTSKHYGQQRVPVPKELYRILRRWIRFNKQGYLFTTSELMPFNASSFAKRLAKIWGKTGMSINTMRHAKLQNTFPELQNIGDIKETLTNMGTSFNSVHHYIKKLP